MPALTLWSCSSSGKHQGLFVLAAAAADARRTGRGHAIVAGPPRPGLCQGWWEVLMLCPPPVRIGPFQSSAHTGGFHNRWRRLEPQTRDVAVRRGSLHVARRTVPGGAVHTGCALRAHRRICSSARSTPVVFWALLSRWLTTDLEKTGLPGGCRIWSEQPGAGAGGRRRPGEGLFNTAANTLQRGPECCTQGGANWFSAV